MLKDTERKQYLKHEDISFLNGTVVLSSVLFPRGIKIWLAAKNWILLDVCCPFVSLIPKSFFAVLFRNLQLIKYISRTLLSNRWLKSLVNPI